MKKKSLAEKIKEAKERTRQWALGVECVKFPIVKEKARLLTRISLFSLTAL
jgi:hypothetical protein